MTTQSGSGKNTGRTTATDANGTAPPSPPESGDPKANGAAKPKKPVSAAQQSRDEATVEVPDVPVASASSAASSPSANDTVIDLDTSAVTGKSPGGSGKAPGTSGPSGSSGPGKGPGGPGAGQTPGTGPGSGKPPAGAVPPAQNATPPALEKTTPDGSGPSSSGSAPGGVGGAGGLGGKPAAPGIAPVKDGPAVPGSDWSQPQEPTASMFAGRNDSTSPRSSSGGTATATKERRGGVGAAVARVTGGGSGKSPRRAQLQLARLEPWSVMKFSFVMSLVCFVVLLVAVTVLYMILSGLGVFDTIATTVNDLTREQGEQSGGLDAGNWFSFVRIFGYTVLVGALNVLLITALSTVGSVIYNLAADLVGGIEVTLKEAE